MKLLVLDGNSVLNRAFYGIRLLSTKDGLYTNAVFGFLNILQKLLQEEAPDAVCVAFDLKAPTFRHKEYTGYKAQRKPMPEELVVQVPLIKETLDAMNINRYEMEGFEADDLIGTISKECAEKGWDCVIATGDRDSLQLIDGHTKVRLVTAKNGRTLEKDMDLEAFLEEYGFPPENLVDLKALMGDSSDNIPGVPGVGVKTATDLIQKHKTISELYENLNSLEIKESLKTKLISGREEAFLSYRLATICRDVPMAFSTEENLRRPVDNQTLYEVFSKMEFRSMMEKFGLQQPAHLPETVRVERVDWLPVKTQELEALINRLPRASRVFYTCPKSLDAFALIADGCGFTVRGSDIEGESYARFLSLFFSGEVKKVGHDVKPLMAALLGYGYGISGFVFDTALGAYLLNPTEGDYSLVKTAGNLLNESLPPAADFEAEGVFGGLLGDEEALSALQAHAQAVKDLYETIEPELIRLGLSELLCEIEMPLCPVLAHMEQAGFLVDRMALQSFGEMLSKEIESLCGDIYALAGVEFNVNSPKQLGEILFERLLLPAPKKTKTGYSTNVEVLEKLQDKHPIIPKIMDYRQLSKLKSTYIDGLIKVIAPDGRIHTSFQMMATATGRLSSTEPNLQNIPIRRALGGEIRKMFVAEPGMVLVDADYSQIELRVLAHIAGDATMQRAFSEGEDIHAVTAAQVFDVPQSEVTPHQRSSAKAVNFGIVYGISDFSLAQDIGVTRGEAGQYINSYLSKYHGVREYMKSIVDQAKADGYVKTLYGRRRYLPELKSTNYNLRSFGERVALNMPIQGTAADIMKIAMIRVHRRLAEEGLAARLILQVHDELIVEAPLAEEERVKNILAQEMEKAADLSIPLVAEANSGESWHECK